MTKDFCHLSSVICYLLSLRFVIGGLLLDFVGQQWVRLSPDIPSQAVRRKSDLRGPWLASLGIATRTSILTEFITLIRGFLLNHVHDHTTPATVAGSSRAGLQARDRRPAPALAVGHPDRLRRSGRQRGLSGQRLVPGMVPRHAPTDLLLHADVPPAPGAGVRVPGSVPDRSASPTWRPRGSGRTRPPSVTGWRCWRRVWSS